MTMEETKNELYRLLSDCVNGGYPLRDDAQKDRYRKAADTAIRSLEAWDAVKADIREIENRPNYMSHSSHYWQGFHEVEDVIKKHLQEVEE